jgi:hypothetical protein
MGDLITTLMKRNIFRATIFLLFVSVCGCSFVKYNQNTRVYTSSIFRFSISLSQGWLPQESKGLVRVIALSPDENANISVLSDFLPKEYTLEKYFDGNYQNLKTDYPNYAELEKGECLINGVESKYVKYTFSKNIINGTCFQYYLVRNQRCYVISCVTSINNFDDYKNDFQEMVLSFSAY